MKIKIGFRFSGGEIDCLQSAHLEREFVAQVYQF